MSSRVRVLVVDDQASMRRLISAHLAADPEIVVVGEAASPSEARNAIDSLRPDVMTLDVEMPEMDGIGFLATLMASRPLPVIMISSHTIAGAATTLRALELGAIDCVAKPSPREPNSLEGLPDKVRAASRAVMRKKRLAVRAKPISFRPRSLCQQPIVAIGASTGGVEALSEILARFPANCPPTVVVQHMPSLFTASFSERLNRLAVCDVSEAKHGDRLCPGQVYIAPGGQFHLEIAGQNSKYCRLVQSDTVCGHRPSVDVLFRSVARAAGANAIGVILTGIGRDGAEGLLRMRNAGARTIAQDEASCVVFGMPRAAKEIGAASTIVPLSRVALEILKYCQTSDCAGETTCHP